jgi:hypothetical protein
MGDHALTFPQPVKDFDLEIGVMARFNLPPLRNAVLDDERVSALTGTEQRVQWRLQRFVRFPDDYPRLHAIAVSQRRVGPNEIRDHVDALLLDAERGDFREGRRFDKAAPSAADQSDTCFGAFDMTVYSFNYVQRPSSANGRRAG